MIYLDASALVTYITQRPNFDALHRYLRSHPGTLIATSTVGIIEAVRNCDRVGDFPNLMAQLVRDYTELRLTNEIRDRAANLPGGLRTLDAIHVATAETLADDLISLISYDKKMLDLATSRGIPVASPGMAA